jgi:sec-independent protein translocase protein TatA
MRSPQGVEWLIILAIVLVLFGAARLPDLARSVGKSMRIFRSEVKGGKDEQPEEQPGASDDPGAPRP